MLAVKKAIHLTGAPTTQMVLVLWSSRLDAFRNWTVNQWSYIHTHNDHKMSLRSITFDCGSQHSGLSLILKHKGSLVFISLFIFFGLYHKVRRLCFSVSAQFD